MFLVASQVSPGKRHHSKLGAQTHPLWSFWTNEVVKYIDWGHQVFQTSSHLHTQHEIIHVHMGPSDLEMT